MEFSNPTVQVKYEHDPGIWLKNNVHIRDNLLSQLQHTQNSAKTKLKTMEILARERRKCRIQFWGKVISHREYTQNVRNWHASFNCKNTLWCLCQNEKLWPLYLKKIVSAKTYQILEEKRSIFTEIQSIFQKYAYVIICKLKFWVRRQLWWRH